MHAADVPTAPGRLRRRHEFEHVRTAGATQAGRQLVLGTAPAPDGRLRVGFITSRRFDRRAVGRNRARRLMREAFAQLAGTVRRPVWIVLIARRGISGRRMQDVRGELARLLARAGLTGEEQT